MLFVARGRFRIADLMELIKMDCGRPPSCPVTDGRNPNQFTEEIGAFGCALRCVASCLSTLVLPFLLAVVGGIIGRRYLFYRPSEK